MLKVNSDRIETLEKKYKASYSKKSNLLQLYNWLAMAHALFESLVKTYSDSTP